MSQTEQTQIDENEGNPSLGAQLLEAELFGETTEQVESGSEPSTTQAIVTSDEPVVNKTEVEQTAQTEAATPEKTVILAKDRIHTIPYETLQKTREQEQFWKQQAQQAQQEAEQAKLALQEAQASATSIQAQNNAEAAKAVIEASGNSEDIINMFGDFSEEAIANGVQALIAQQLPNKIQEAINQALAPIQQQQQLTAQQAATQAHFAVIHEKYPDAEVIAESEQFSGWLNKQPSIIQKAYQTVLDKGSAIEVVELLDLYTAESNTNHQAKAPTAEMVEKAKQAVQSAPLKVPHSVTDLPAGTPAGQSVDERLKGLSSQQLLEEMENWSPDQIEAYMDRNA